MNVSIIDPLQGDFPEVIEEYLEHGVMKCIAFNRRGTLLAAGCADGSCVIWDFETRGIAKELRDNDCVAPITSMCWSKCGHFILAAAVDKSLTLWDVMSGEKMIRVPLQQNTLHARLHPGSARPSMCLACPIASAPVLVDLNTGSITVLPVSVPDAGNNSLPRPRNKFVDGSPPFTVSSASFNKHGDLIYVGNSKGEILIMGTNDRKVKALISVPGNSVIKNIVFSRSGQYVLINSNDRAIRVFQNHLPQKDASTALDKISEGFKEMEIIQKLKWVGSNCLTFFRDFQDSITRLQWKVPCFSGDEEWVVGASASKGEHKMYIWARTGHFVKMLEGPKEALTDLAWHPLQPMVVSVSMSGLVYIWAKDHTENWSAFAPDFKELEENEEYVEREDEFDLMPETEKVKMSDFNQDEEVDIMFVEEVSSFNDSDVEDELCFLPAIPLPDSPEQQDNVRCPPKLDESTHSDSPVSEEVRVKGIELNMETSPAEEDVSLNLPTKRKRKLSQKGAELLAEKARQPSTKKPSVKSSKTAKRSREVESGPNRLHDDDQTDG